MRVPDNETFRINTLSAYNVIESACKLGIKKIILASSLTTYGIPYAEGDMDWPHFPVTEESPTQPMDVYAASKLCMEQVASSFARRFKDVDIYAFRIGAVIEPENFEKKFQSYIEQPERWKVHGWSYTDARDLGNMVHCGLKTDGLGFQIFNALNDEITNKEETTPFLKKMSPKTPILRELGPREAPICSQKMKDLLGFREEYGWRKLLG